MGTTCLTVCAECSRHLRCEERVCPFCGARNQASLRVAEYRIKSRLSRGQAFSLGASLTLAGFSTSCEEGGDALHSVYGAPCNPPSCVFPGTAGAAGTPAHGGSPSAGGANGTAGSSGRAGASNAGTGGTATAGTGGSTVGGDSGGATEGGAGGQLAAGAGGELAGGAGGDFAGR